MRGIENGRQETVPLQGRRVPNVAQESHRDRLREPNHHLRNQRWQVLGDLKKVCNEYGSRV